MTIDAAGPPSSVGGDTGAAALPGWLAVVLVAGTSAAVLVLEILAGRLLAPYVGVSLDTYTGIIGTILAGIAFGAWAGGYAADRVDPRRLLPVLLAVGGALAIASIPVVRTLGSSTTAGGGPMILILSAFGFLPAATVLSAVPPAVIKLQLQNLDETGSMVGRLSAWSTAGAIFGTFFTGFVLVAAAAVSTLIVATGIALIASGVAMAIYVRREVPSRRLAATEVFSAGAVGLLALVGAATIDSPCETQTTYYCVSVVTDPGDPRRQTLVLDDLRHSAVNLDDPTELSFWYIRRLADAIEAAPAAADIVYVGGGALTLPRYIRATQRGTTQTVLEIDGDLIGLVEQRMGLDTVSPAPIDVVIGDARLSMRRLSNDSADVVIGDAFGSRSVPFHLATEEFMADIDRVLRPGGLYAANVIDGPGQQFLAAETATVAAVFDHVAVVRGAGIIDGRPGNSVIVGSDSAEAVDRFHARVVEAAAADAEDAASIVDDLSAFVSDAPVLTDDFAPVDQLIAASTP